MDCFPASIAELVALAHSGSAAGPSSQTPATADPKSEKKLSIPRAAQRPGARVPQVVQGSNPQYRIGDEWAAIRFCFR
jgi:hypothetical protein